HAAPCIVEPHAVLRHFFEQHGHAKGVESAAPILFRRAQAPELGGLGFLHETVIVVFGNVRCIGIDTLLDGNNFLTDDASYLFSQHRQVLWEREAGEYIHQSASRKFVGCTCAPVLSVREAHPTFEPKVKNKDYLARRNFGSVTSGVTSSKTTSTGMSSFNSS